MFDILQYPFMQRAIIAGFILAAVLALLGVYVLMRKMSFFSDGIAHASLSGIALGIVMSWHPTTTALILSVIFALIIYFIEKKFELASDTIIGIIFTSGMAIGVLLISMQPGYQPEIITFLFGNILAIQTSELWLMGILSLLIIIFISKNFKSLTLLSLDEELAHVSNIKVQLLQPMFYVALTLAVVLGVKILGIILVSALLILPTASARVVSDSFKKFIALSIMLAEIMVFVGIIISAIYDLPTGPVIVLVGTNIFFIFIIFKTIFKNK